MSQLSERHRKMLTPEGFCELVAEEQSSYYSFKEAFWELNREYEDVFGTLRYNSYESFRVVYHRNKSRDTAEK